MNATELIADVKLKAQITSNNGTYSDADILNIASKELQTVIVPKIMAVREKYLEYFEDYSISSTRSYRIPSYAVGNKLFQVEIIDSAGNARSIPMIASDLHSRTESFYISSSSVVLSSSVPSTGTLRLKFAARPGDLTETNSVVTNVSFDGGASYTLDLTTNPFNQDDFVCIQKSNSPYEYVLVREIVDIVSGVQIVISLANGHTAPKVGDIVTFMEKTPVFHGRTSTYYPQVPDEFHDWLSMRTAIRILASLGHAELLAIKQNELKDIESDLLSLITPRVDGSPKVVVGGDLLGWCE